MSKRRYGEKNSNTIFRWLYFVLFGVISIWLIISIISTKSPLDILKNTFTTESNSELENSANPLLVQKDSIIQSLTLQLSQCRGETSYSRAMVIIESQTLNLRSEPSLSSEIILKIPANSEVELLYYDNNTYILEGESGKWCKVKYAGKEGWAWGNFIKEI